jgi:hypothetical protein
MFGALFGVLLVFLVPQHRHVQKHRVVHLDTVHPAAAAGVRAHCGVLLVVQAAGSVQLA